MNDNEEHSRHQVFDIAEIGNVDRVTRVFNLAHTECLELLYPFTKKALEDELVFNDELKEPEEYTIEMEVSTEFSKSTIVLLENLIHEYFICRALSDWMSITKPTSKANWQEKLDDIKNRIKNSVLWRRKRLRITQHPF